MRMCICLGFLATQGGRVRHGQNVYKSVSLGKSACIRVDFCVSSGILVWRFYAGSRYYRIHIDVAQDCDEGKQDKTVPDCVATDDVGDGVDQNCDGIDGIDNDGDGYASLASGGMDCDDDDLNLTPLDNDGDGYSLCEADCDDSDPLLSPADADLDGQSSCNGDCDDTDASVYVGAAFLEDVTLCMRDSDQDGWGDSTDSAPFVAGLDCDDSDSTLNRDDVDQMVKTVVLGIAMMMMTVLISVLPNLTSCLYDRY